MKRMILFAVVMATFTNCSNLPNQKGKDQLVPLVNNIPGINTVTIITVPGTPPSSNPSANPNDFWVGNKDWNNDGAAEFTIGDTSTGFMQKLNMPGPSVGVTSSAFNWNCTQIYVTGTISGQDNIWKYDIASSTYSQITTDTGFSHVIWSADPTGRYFLYNHLDASLYVYDTVLNTSTLVHTFTGSVEYASWKDSNTLIVSIWAGSNQRLWYYNITTQALTRVTLINNLVNEMSMRQDGADYYVIGSDGSGSPTGQELFHSTDLINFTIISNNARFLMNHPGDNKVYYSDIANISPTYPWTEYSFTSGVETSVFPSGNSIGIQDFCRGYSTANIP